MRTSKGLLIFALLVLAAPARAVEAPFERDLMRLAEILGSLHFLKTLCGDESIDWRGEMAALLDAERPDPQRRERFIASFNSGYRAFASTYTRCTPSATAAITLYAAEGDKLTREVTSRFGN